ncbi:hypothetical protein [Mycolicibacterium helvum]|uniref:Uncharacterized protein n=1 Tax=Mycolicibacterium helvum TaxID=1534349 RepID=A0A7I7TDF8_9MYCO|nr:hypothetical protein [Mycolicibacterium helvum]BBY66176.1 hypothetical protein MHEL_44190 [Mycolicibacterium helvum]
MGTLHIVILIGGALLLVGVAYEVMSRLNQTAIREHERRREEWRAAGLEGPSPGEGLRGGGDGGGGG